MSQTTINYGFYFGQQSATIPTPVHDSVHDPVHGSVFGQGLKNPESFSGLAAKQFDMQKTVSQLQMENRNLKREIDELKELLDYSSSTPTCGEYGGVCLNGTPCRKICYGRCKKHTIDYLRE